MVVDGAQRLWALLVMIVLGFTACPGDPALVDLCDGVACSSQGSCVTDGVSPYCACEDGFHPKGLGCVENDEADRCLGVDCMDHGTCEVTEESLPRCICDAPFENSLSSTLCLNTSGAPIHDAGVDAPDTDIDDRDSDSDERICELGTTQVCTCYDGASGVQTCDGDRWGLCVCDEPPCDFGDLRECRCADDTLSFQTCVGGTWLDCVCDDPTECDDDERRPCMCSETAAGEQACFFGEWGDCMCAEVGETCTSQPDCASSVDMLCVLQQAGDTYGICTLTCDDWTDCVVIDDFYSCCDIADAGAACLPSDWECDDV